MGKKKQAAARRALNNAAAALQSPALVAGVAALRDRAAPRVKLHPRSSDAMLGYGIGNCSGCERYPVVLYRVVGPERWRCAKCCKKETGNPPQNMVTA